jgi:FERM/RhoGEF/pleckstrin domain protein 2
MTREGSMARGSQGDHSSLRGGEGGGARSRTPPGTPKKAGGKMLAVRVQMLDDSITSFQVQVQMIVFIKTVYSYD